MTSSSVEVPLLQPQRKGRDLSFLKLLGELVESGSFSIVALILRHAGWAVCAVALKPACRDLRRIVNDTGGTDCLDWSELLVGVGTRCASHKFLLKGLARVARITTSGRLGCGQSRRGSVACACERFAGAFFPPGRLFVGLALLVNTIWGVPSSRTQSQRCLPWPHHRPSHLRSGRACPAFKGWSFPPCPAERSRLPMPRAARLTTSSARAFGPRCRCLVCWFQVRVAVCRFAMSLLSSNSCDPPRTARAARGRAGRNGRAGLGLPPMPIGALLGHWCRWPRRPAYSTGASIPPHACVLYGCHSVRSSRPILRRAPARCHCRRAAAVPCHAARQQDSDVERERHCGLAVTCL